MINRVSTALLYSFGTRSIQENQRGIYTLSNKMNTGKQFNNAYEDPVGIIGSTQFQGRILNNEQATKDRNTAISDLSAQETVLNNLIDISDRIFEMSVAAGNDTISSTERNAYRDELRTLGETVVQLVNTKIGEKYAFSGKQSDLQTLRLPDGASFDQAIYKHNQDNGEDRVVAGAQASVSIGDVLLGQADGASSTNSVINPITTIAGNIDFEIDDGNGNLTGFTVTTGVGDDLATLIAAINAEFLNAGGVGTVAQESPNGYLQLNTNLITGNSQNKDARISILASSDENLTNEIGLNRQDTYGRDAGFLRTIANLETALSANDAVTIRGLLDDLKSNSADLNSARSKIGLLTSQAERLNDAAENLDLKLRSDLSQAQDLDMVDATIRLRNMQTALQTSVQTTANIFSLSLDSFIV